MNGPSKWISAIYCITLLSVCGCQKQEETAKEPPKQTKEHPRIVDKSAITPQVAEAFPMLHKYFYPFGTVLSSSTVPNEEEDFQVRSKLPDIIKVEYNIETNDSVEELFSFYQELFKDDVLRRFTRKIHCSHLLRLICSIMKVIKTFLMKYN